MLTADGGKNGKLRRNHLGEFFDFAADISAHFADEVVKFFMQFQFDDLGDTENSIVAFWRLESGFLTTENFEKKVFGAGFAVTAGDPDNGEVGVVDDLLSDPMFG